VGVGGEGGQRGSYIEAIGGSAKRGEEMHPRRGGGKKLLANKSNGSGVHGVEKKEWWRIEEQEGGEKMRGIRILSHWPCRRRKGTSQPPHRRSAYRHTFIKQVKKNNLPPKRETAGDSVPG